MIQANSPYQSRQSVSSVSIGAQSIGGTRPYENPIPPNRPMRTEWSRITPLTMLVNRGACWITSQIKSALRLPTMVRGDRSIALKNVEITAADKNRSTSADSSVHLPSRTLPILKLQEWLLKRTECDHSSSSRLQSTDLPSIDTLKIRSDKLLSDLDTQIGNRQAEIEARPTASHNDIDQQITILTHLKTLVNLKSEPLQIPPHHLEHNTDFDDNHPTQIEYRQSAATLMSTIENALKQYEIIPLVEQTTPLNKTIFNAIFNNFSQSQLQSSRSVSKALYQIQSARAEIYDRHIQCWSNNWALTRLLPELREASKDLLSSHNATPKADLLAIRLLANLESGRRDRPGTIPYQGALTLVVDSLLHTESGISNTNRSTLQSHQQTASLLTKIAAGEPSDINMSQLDEMVDTLNHLSSQITSGEAQLTLKKRDRAALLRAIDAITTRVHLASRFTDIANQLGESTSETLTRFIQLRPYLTEIEALDHLIGPVTDQQESLQDWRRALKQSTHSLLSNSSTLAVDDRPSYSSLWLTAIAHEIATEQALEQLEQTHQLLNTLDKLNPGGEQIGGTDNNKSKASGTHSTTSKEEFMFDALDSALPITNAHPTLPAIPDTLKQEKTRNRPTDLLQTRIATNEGLISVFDAAIWKYLDRYHPGELSGEVVDIDLLKGARGYELALERLQSGESKAILREKSGVRDNIDAATIGDWIYAFTLEYLSISFDSLPARTPADHLRYYSLCWGMAAAGATIALHTALQIDPINESFHHIGLALAACVAVSTTTSAIILGALFGFVLGQWAINELPKYHGVRPSRPNTLNTQPTTIEPAFLALKRQLIDSTDTTERSETAERSPISILDNYFDRWAQLINNEVSTGKFRLNSAFENFNPASPVLKDFRSRFSTTGNSSLPKSSIDTITEQVRTAQFETALTSIAQLLNNDHSVESKLELYEGVIYAAEHRNIRNIVNFSARAEREQRSLNRSESEMVKLWLSQLASLYATHGKTLQMSDIAGQESHLTHHIDIDIDIDSELKQFLYIMELKNSIVDQLIEQTQVSIQQYHSDAPAVATDTNILRPRQSNWMLNFRKVAKAFADPFDYDVQHSSRIPKSGRVIINCNHGMLTFDLGWLVDWVREVNQRDLRMVVDRMLSRMPFVGSILHSVGFHEGRPQDFQAFLAAELAVSVAVGGIVEALKSPSFRNILLSDERLNRDGSYRSANLGFIKDQLTTAAPVINALTPRSDDIAHATDTPLSQFFLDHLHFPIGIVQLLNPQLNKVSTYVSEPIPAPILPESDPSIHSSSFKKRIRQQHRSVTDRAQAQMIASDIVLPFQRTRVAASPKPEPS